MGGLNVKNTIVERVLQIIAPHPCSGCGKIGSILCNDCKYDIIHEPFAGCILCETPQRSGICAHHKAPFSRAFTVSTRADALEDAINRLKFHNTKQSARSLAELFNESLPQLPSSMFIVPLPTVRSHIRQRGYDQVALLARHLSALRSLPVCNALARVTSATQHRVGRRERHTQADRAFALQPGLSLQGKQVLLIDDIVTTGASLKAAAAKLTEAGCEVWVATLAYSPLKT